VSLPARALHELDDLLAGTDAELARRYPGPARERQPVHTVYVPADRVSSTVVSEWGAQALELLDTHERLLIGLLPSAQLAACLPRARAKLASQPIEDLRIDFEDGYGYRPDSVEDADAEACGKSVVAIAAAPDAPLVIGIRFKGLDAGPRARAIRTLDLVVEAAIGQGGLPPRFVVTVPKVRSVEQVEAMVRLCELLEETYGLDNGRLRFELQVEAPPAIVGANGTATIATALHAAAGRCLGLHFGTYDYTAAIGVTAGQQSMAHPAADHAKAVMQAAAAETGVVVSDGSTQRVPVGTSAEIAHAWSHHAGLVTRSLERAFYQGWDLHPGQLVTRYLATFAFYRTGLAPAGRRLTAYVDKASTGVLDEPATARALAALVVRGVQCGAVDADEAAAATGLTPPQLDQLYRTGVLA
jgi:citrate lyase beta subunit